MSAVGLTWELDVWKPKLAALLGAAPRPLTDEVRDACVLSSLDALPVPVVQVPMKDALPTLDLGWVGESLTRLEAAGQVRRLDCVDRRMYMKSALAPRQEGGR